MYSRQGVFFKKKHRLKIVREIPSNVKHLCDRGAVVDWLTNCGLSVAYLEYKISGEYRTTSFGNQ